MSYSSYNRTTSIDDQFRTILSAQGFVNTTSAYFLNQLLTSLKRAYKDQFSELYAIASQVDIARASNQYLDRWGTVLAQPRTSATYAADLTLSNVRIQITPIAIVSQITSDENGLSFPAGTIIRDNASTVMVELVDPAHIEPSANGVYVRVIASTPGLLSIPAGTLTVIDFPISETGAIIPNGASSYSFEVIQIADITGGNDALTDDDAYRYILEKKAESWGLVNESRFQTLMAIDDLVDVTMKEVPGGVHIYLDTKHPSFDTMSKYVAAQVIKAFSTKGLHFAVFTPVYRQMTMRLQLALDTTGTTVYDKVVVAGDIKTRLNLSIANLPMGTTIDPYTIVDTLSNEIAGIGTLTVSNVTYNGKTVIAEQIPQQFNEKGQLPITGIVIS